MLCFEGNIFIHHQLARSVITLLCCILKAIYLYIMSLLGLSLLYCFVFWRQYIYTSSACWVCHYFTLLCFEGNTFIHHQLARCVITLLCCVLKAIYLYIISLLGVSLLYCVVFWRQYIYTSSACWVYHYFTVLWFEGNIFIHHQLARSVITLLCCVLKAIYLYIISLLGVSLLYCVVFWRQYIYTSSAC